MARRSLARVGLTQEAQHHNGGEQKDALSTCQRGRRDYFFTVNLAKRCSDVLVRHIDEFRAVINGVKAIHPFTLIAMVVLPEHLQAIWRLPPDDANYPLRWSLIKAGFSRRLIKDETIRASRITKRERGIWQRRYWEHQIRNDADLARHVDYIHYNPVRHGLVAQAIDWPYSTIQGYIVRGMFSKEWGCGDLKQHLDICGER